MNILPREERIQIAALLMGGHGIRETARITGVDRNTVNKYADNLKAGAIPDIEAAARPRIVMRPGKGKRGRMIRTETGREVSHEEVMTSLVKRTAVDIATSGRPSSIVCQDCPAVVRVSAIGGIPLRCRRCANKARFRADPERERARQRSKWSRTKAARAALAAPTVEALTDAARLLSLEDRKRLAVAILTI